MFQTDQTTFERIVDEAILAIPEEFRKKLENVAFFIEEFPNPAQKKKIALRRGWTLFGLYEGVPHTRRGTHYFGVLPDRITVFRQPMQYFAQDEEHLKQIVKNTIWHEIAHHFGMNEHEVRNAEKNRGHKY